MKNTNIPFLVCFAILIFSLSRVDFAFSANFTDFVVPNSLASTEGNSVADFPFDGVLGSMPRTTIRIHH